MKKHLSLCVTSLMVAALFLAVFTFSRVGGNFIATYKDYAFSFFIGIGLLCLGVYLAAFSFKNPIGIKFNPIDALLVCWVIYLFLSFLLHHSNPDIEATLVFVLCVVSYFLIRILLAGGYGGVAVNVMVYGLLIMSSLQALIGLLQFYGLLPSLNELFVITGTFQNPAPFALFIAVCFPISLSARLFRRGRMLRRLSLVNMILAILVLPLTGIRTSWIAAVAGSLWVLEFKFNLLQRSSRFIRVSVFRRWAVYVFVAAILITSGVFLYRLKALSADSRLLVWRVSLDKLLEAPVFGVGYGNFKGQYCNWQVDYFTRHPAVLNGNYASGVPVYDFAGFVKMAYNDYLQTAVEQGLVGFGFLFWILLIVIRRSVIFFRKKRDLLLIGAWGGFISLLLSGLFSYPFYSLPTYFLFFAFLAIINERLAFVSMRSFPVGFRRYLLPGIGLVFVLVSGYVLAHTLTGGGKYLQYENARVLNLQESSREAQASYAAVFEELKNDPAYLLDYGICLVNNKLPDSALSILSLAAGIDCDPRLYLLMGNILKERNDYKAAERMYIKAHLILPSRIYPKYLLALLYEKEGDTVSAIQLAREILSNPVRQDDRLGESIVQEMTDFLKKCKVRSAAGSNLIHYGQYLIPLFNN